MSRGGIGNVVTLLGQVFNVEAPREGTLFEAK